MESIIPVPVPCLRRTGAKDGATYARRERRERGDGVTHTFRKPCQSASSSRMCRVCDWLGAHSLISERRLA